LRKIKLIDSLTINLQIDKEEFVKRLSSVTDNYSLNGISDFFDTFSSSKNEFKGQVDLNGFKIKRRRRFFDTNMNFALITGTFSESNDGLIIDTEINGFHSFIIIFYLILIIFYSCIFVGLVCSTNALELLAIPFLLVHGLFMFSIPYFTIRRGIKRIKYELEREFFYLTKNA
jgi:hypothetical protein